MDTDGEKNGRTVGVAEGRTGGWKDGDKKGRRVGRTDGGTDGWMEKQTDGRTNSYR